MNDRRGFEGKKVLILLNSGKTIKFRFQNGDFEDFKSHFYELDNLITKEDIKNYYNVTTPYVYKTDEGVIHIDVRDVSGFIYFQDELQRMSLDERINRLKGDGSVEIKPLLLVFDSGKTIKVTVNNEIYNRLSHYFKNKNKIEREHIIISFETDEGFMYLDIKKLTAILTLENNVNNVTMVN